MTIELAGPFKAAVDGQGKPIDNGIQPLPDMLPDFPSGPR